MNGKDPRSPGAQAGLDAERALRSHFAGRRGAGRRDLELPVELKAGTFRVRAETVNASRSGILFRVREDDLPADAAYRRPDRIFVRLLQHFGKGLWARFGAGVLQRRMELVRAAHGGLGAGPEIRMACRFLHPLTETECDLLGILPCARSGAVDTDALFFDGEDA